MTKQIMNFTKFGDASVELKQLYSQGWSLKTVVPNAAISMTEETAFGKMIPGFEQYIKDGNSSGNRYFLYSVEYFLEKEN